MLVNDTANPQPVGSKGLDRMFYSTGFHHNLTISDLALTLLIPIMT